MLEIRIDTEEGLSRPVSVREPAQRRDTNITKPQVQYMGEMDWVAGEKEADWWGEGTEG